MISKTKQTGFTLIEIMVVTSVVSLLLPTLFAIVFTLLRLQYQVGQLQRLKESGDYVSNLIINQVKSNAIAIDNDNCQTTLQPQIQLNSNYIFFRDRGNYCFGYYEYEQKLYQVAESGSTIKSATLVESADTDFPIQVSNLSLSIQNNRLARVNMTLLHQPNVSYLKDQSLEYRFYAYIRE